MAEPNYITQPELDVAVSRLETAMAQMETRLITRMDQQQWRTIGVVFVIASLLFAGLRYLPPVS